MTDVYAQRRQRVLAQLAPDSIMVLSAAPELLVGRDTHLRYVVDAEVYYLTGYTEPDTVLVLDRSAAYRAARRVRAPWCARKSAHRRSLPARLAPPPASADPNSQRMRPARMQ